MLSPFSLLLFKHSFKRISVILQNTKCDDIYVFNYIYAGGFSVVLFSYTFFGGIPSCSPHTPLAPQ